MSPLPARRDILKLFVLTAGTLPAACYRAAVDSPVLSADQSAAYFPQSVASGDPRPDSVVLWVRVEDAERAGDDAELELVLALDSGLTQIVPLSGGAENLLALAQDDHCVQVRVSGLQPATTYHYRFRYRCLEGTAESRIGRTRTAPAEDSAAQVRFAVTCCQDYAGKYFHVLRQISQQDLDFVLHLGDYIYESTQDPSFQSATEERSARFSAPAEALELGRGERRYLAANSLSNYRDLYKLYRSDPDLQALHEKHPIIAIWDDHEFSDDSHGDVATNQDGRIDESSPERRAAADQAWFEYMPVDYHTAPARKLNPRAEFPGNFAIYRSFVFGQHLELVLTDLRRFRPDHLVPEDALPGAVCLTAADVADVFAEPPDDLVPYVDVDSLGGGQYLEFLKANADALQISAESLGGNLSAVWINAALTSLARPDSPPAIDLDDPSLLRGYAYHSLLKSSQFSRVGSRYVVAVRPFEALAHKLWQASEGRSEMLMGQPQRDWFLNTVRGSKRTFKVWASEIALQSRHVDLSDVPAAPPELRTLISISAEDWDGFPNERRALLRELASVGNVLVLSGDLHSFFAGTPFAEGDEDARVVELTTGSATSTTWLDGIAGSLVQDSSLPMNVQQLVSAVPFLLADPQRRPNPHLAFQELGKNGYSVVEVGPDAVAMTLHLIDPSEVATDPQRLKARPGQLFTTERFRMRAGSAELEREVNGEFLTWNRAELRFR